MKSKYNISLRINNATFKDNSFSYLRGQTPNDLATDGTKGGVIYTHSWGTGYQQLIFKDDATASKWWYAECKRILKAKKPA